MYSFFFEIASTVIWYVCVCILFVVAFLSLVLSVLYFITGKSFYRLIFCLLFNIQTDTSSEEVIKLYGITGAGTLAIVTFIIVFLDCCNDGSREDFEEETVYRILQVNESKENALATQHKPRIAEGKEEKSRPFIIQHQRPPISSNSHPHPYHHHYPHYYPDPVQHNHVHPPTSYHDSFVCPICHDLHAPQNARHTFTDIAVDTSDKFQPVSKNKKAVHKSTRDAQTHPRMWDSERGTQTDRTAGTQTSTMELSGIPSNITEIIHETTILKAPRGLLATLRKSMVQQDKDIAINRAVTGSNTMTTAIV
jgi:hypothetical protein